MLDNLRNGSEADFKTEEPTTAPTAPLMEKPKPRRTFDQLTGTSALQRFILATLLLITVCLAGFLLLALTGKIVPFFLY